MISILLRILDFSIPVFLIGGMIYRYFTTRDPKKIWEGAQFDLQIGVVNRSLINSSTGRVMKPEVVDRASQKLAYYEMTLALVDSRIFLVYSVPCLLACCLMSYELFVQFKWMSLLSCVCAGILGATALIVRWRRLVVYKQRLAEYILIS